MGEIFITIFVLIAVVALAMMGFIAWVVVSIIKAIARTATSFRSHPKPPAVRQPAPPPLAPAPQGPPALQYFPPRNQQATAEQKCPRDNCRHMNPPEAQFCRRCGINLVAQQARRSAVASGRVLAGA